MENGTPARRKLNNTITEDKSSNELPEVLDGGFGWVVVFASFCVHTIS